MRARHRRRRPFRERVPLLVGLLVVGLLAAGVAWALTTFRDPEVAPVRVAEIGSPPVPLRFAEEREVCNVAQQSGCARQVDVATTAEIVPAEAAARLVSRLEDRGFTLSPVGDGDQVATSAGAFVYVTPRDPADQAVPSGGTVVTLTIFER